MRFFSGASIRNPPRPIEEDRTIEPSVVAESTLTAVPAPITLEEPLTRFVLDREHLRPATPHVFWRAFRPKPADDELSIARIKGLPALEIWSFADASVGLPSKRSVLGRADFQLPNIRNAQHSGNTLDAIPQEPPARHAVIIGWPHVNDEARRAMAMILAAESKQVLRDVMPSD